jgi:hypothetical protein
MHPLVKSHIIICFFFSKISEQFNYETHANRFASVVSSSCAFSLKNYPNEKRCKMYIIKMKCVYLSFTTLFLVFPILFFLCNTKKTIYEFGLASLLTANLILSFLFWTHPIENSFVHYYDGIFAKISYVIFSIYILFVKRISIKLRILSFAILLMASTTFYYSNYYSKMDWCSDIHFSWHFIFHFLCGVGCSIAFI